MRNTLKPITIILVVSLITSCVGKSGEDKSKDVVAKDVAPLRSVETDTLCKSLEWMVVSSDENILFVMPYADTSNFTHQKLYGCAKCQLRSDVALALEKASQEAKKSNLMLLVFDCYRPFSVQEKMYEIINDERYVAKPGKGSNHNKGCAVDLSLADAQGKPLDMGTAFDDFSEKAHYAFSGLSAKQRANRIMLRTIMTRAGFKPYESEWWHFNFKDLDYPVSNHQLPCD